MESGKKLQSLEDHYYDLYDNAPDFFATVDAATGRILECNNTLAVATGYSKEEITCLPHISNLYHPDSEDARKTVFDAFVHTGCVRDAELQLMRKNGSPIDVSLNISAIRNEDGKVLRSRSIWRDITRRKQAEEALNKANEELEFRVRQRTAELEEANECLQREITERTRSQKSLQDNEERLRLLLESTGAMPWIADARTWQFTYVGPQVEAALGYSVENWYEQNFWVEHIHPDDREWAVDFCQKSSERLSDYNFQYRMLASDGHVVWILDVVNVEASNGVPTKLRGFMIDVTDRKRSQQLFEGLLESAPDAIVLADESRTIVLVNAQTERLFGYSRAELIGQPIEKLIPTRFHDKHVKHYSYFMGEAKPRDMGTGLDLFGKRRDGNEFPVEISLSPIRKEEGFLVCSAIRDISVRKRTEEAYRQQRDELAHVSRAATMVEISAALAHELSQPLAAILRNAQAGQRFLNRDTPNLDEVGEILTDIVKDNSRAGDILSRIRQHLKKEKTPREPVDMNEVVKDSLKILHSELIIKHVHVTLQLARRLPPILGNSVELQQVILNLILNAVEAMKELSPENRTLIVATDSADGHMVRVFVGDSGPGIDENELEQIFDPFHTTKKDGMGVGLAINRTIVEAHDGKMWAESLPERGARLIFTLPTVSPREDDGDR